MNHMKRTWISCCLALPFAAAASAPREAEACGGLFCDGGPMPIPVDQSGENILFVWEGDTIEAHIQIQYTGDPAQFSWVIPLQSVPEFSVGSQPLFDALLAGSVPTYGYSQTFDDCSDPGASAGAPDGGLSTAAGGDGGESGNAGEDGGGPEIVLHETVGAFEVTVLQGDDPQEVITWLNENGYAQDPEAEPILADYIATGHLFGAVKLTGGSGLGEIHPIVLTFNGSEPCVPLKLTRIAAVENMEVRSFFLGASRMVPSNYRHVLINALKLDWLTAANYKDVITLAVDEKNADGRAFVTEYAGPSDVVVTGGVNGTSWDAAAFGTLAASDIGTTLTNQGLLFCDFDFGNGCTFTHPLLEGLLGQFITPPNGVPAPEYYADQASYAEVDTTGWDGAMFGALFTDRIVEPGRHAEQLVLKHPYLTRMYTIISPAEMTEDPMFQGNASLPEVPAIQNGVLRTLCNGDRVFTLPDGREVYLPAGSNWPALPDEPGGLAGAMPSSEIIEAVPPSGAPMRLTDNREKIDLVLADWNAQNGWDGAGPTDGSGGSGGSEDGGPGQTDDDGGCGCTSDRSPVGSYALAGVVLLGLARRRRRGNGS